MNRTLDYVPRLVEANRAYRVSGNAYTAELLHRSRYWTPGYPVLDQGREGACVGFGCTGEAMASPVRVKFTDEQDATVMWARGPDGVARAVYRRALQIDEFEGERDEGTSVRAGMLVGRERGWWSGFKWAMNMLELRAALEEGPVVIGVEWREQMYDAPNGVLAISGPPVGGHCLLVTGYAPQRRGWSRPVYRLRNSWGADWGIRGSAYLHDTSLNEILFQAGGEAAVPVGRAM